jgi:hypothetical protein
MATYGDLRNRIASQLNRSELDDQISEEIQSAIEFLSVERFPWNERLIYLRTVDGVDIYPGGATTRAGTVTTGVTVNLGVFLTGKTETYGQTGNIILPQRIMGMDDAILLESVTSGNTYTIPLDREDVLEINRLRTSAATSGRPYVWAWGGGRSPSEANQDQAGFQHLHLYPMPNKEWLLQFHCVLRVGDGIVGDLYTPDSADGDGGNDPWVQPEAGEELVRARVLAQMFAYYLRDHKNAQFYANLAEEQKVRHKRRRDRLITPGFGARPWH